MIQICPFIPSLAAYDAIAHVHNSAWPDERQITGALLQDQDQEWPAHAPIERLIAVDSAGSIVGEGAAYVAYWEQGNVMHMDFSVLPAVADLAVDVQLYDALEATALRLVPDCPTFASTAREDDIARMALLMRQGFRPALRILMSALTLTDADLSSYTHIEQRLQAQQIVIRSLPELQPMTPDWKQRLYELRWAIIQDVPAVEPPSRPTMEEFETMVFGDPAFRAPLWFLALDQAQPHTKGETAPFIGQSNLWDNDPSGRRLDTGLTGVLRSYRRRGIAKALKLAAIRYAHEQGYQQIVTGNEEHNPMYKLNEQLGFRPLPAWVSYRKERP